MCRRSQTRSLDLSRVRRPFQKKSGRQTDELLIFKKAVEIATVEPRNNSLAFKGSPSIKVNILRSKMVVFKVISPLFKGYPEIKVKNLQSQWDR